MFYPSHDIALANGIKHFNPPLAALRLQEDLSSLSDIWNGPYRRGEVPFPQPWGWDWDTRRFIQETYKIKASQLPTDEDLASIRELSSRQTTVTLLTRLNERMPEGNFVMPEYLTSVEQAEAYLMRQKDCVFKTLWSSSGRGLMRSTFPLPTLRKQLGAAIRRMGGVMGEAWRDDKVQDFAMLFFVGTDSVRFVGYSLFDNDAATYRQGYLLSNERIVEKLGVDKALLDAIRDHYIELLSELFAPLMHKPWQVGFVGIDMLTYGTADDLKVSPCVEMNLRCTMGVVCRLWYDEHKEEGVFSVSPMSEDGHFKAQFLTRTGA